jgi:hypothetical protein
MTIEDTVASKSAEDSNFRFETIGKEQKSSKIVL